MNVTTHRERMLRKHAATIGMRVRRSGTRYELHYGNSAVLDGTLDPWRPTSIGDSSTP
jgi:hypothetical protein